MLVVATVVMEPASFGIFYTNCMVGPERYYADWLGGSNGDLDLLELIDGRSYKGRCRSASEIREAESMGEGLLTQRSSSYRATRRLHLPPPP